METVAHDLITSERKLMVYWDVGWFMFDVRRVEALIQ